MVLSLSYALLHSSYVQTSLVNYFTSRIERTTGVKIQIGGVDFRPMRSLVLSDMLLRDYRDDTLFYCRNFNVKIDSFRFSTRSFSVKEVVLDRAYFNLWIVRGPEEAVMNLDVFLDSLQRQVSTDEKKKNTGKQWLVGLGKICIRNSRFVYKEEEYEPVDYGINWTDVECRKINADISGFDFSGGKTALQVSALSLIEKSGFVIRSLDSRVQVQDSNLLLTHTEIETARSRLDLKKLEFNWVPGQRDWRNFTTRMQQYYELAPSTVSFIDLAYFNGILRGIDNTVTGSGVVFNTVNRIEGRDLKIKFGEQSVIRGKFKSHGLPDFRKTVFDIEFENSQISPVDLETIYLPWFSRKIDIPAPLHSWPVFDMNARFRGSPEDFAVEIESFTGGIQGNATLAYRTGQRDSVEETVISGKFNFPFLHAGRLSGFGQLGQGSLSGSYSGRLDEEHTELNASGKVHTLRLGKGRLKDIDVFLTLENDNINLVSTVDDDSVRAGLVLKYDGRDSVSFCKANGYVDIGDLSRFGLSLTGRKESVKTDFDLVFAKKDKKNHFGNLCLSGFTYGSSYGKCDVDTISLENHLNNGFYTTTLKSDIADFLIEGHYMSIRPLGFTDQLIRSYLPAYRMKLAQAGDNFEMKEVDFGYTIEMKDMNRLLQAVYPEVRIAEGTKIFSVFNPQDQYLRMTVLSDSLRYKDLHLSQSRLELDGNSDRLQVIYTADQLDYHQLGRLYNVRNELVMSDNRVDEKLLWSNWNSQTFSGELSARLVFMPSEREDYKTEIYIRPGVVVMADSVWKIGESSVFVEGKDIDVRNFRFYNGRQYLAVNGRVSEQPEDSLSFKLNNFDLRELNRVLFDNRLGIFGIATGNVVVQDYYKDNLLYSDIRVRNWGFDRDTLGSLELKSYWDADSNRILIRAANRVGEDVPLRITGDYRPASDSINIDIHLAQVGIGRLGKYASEYFTESGGGLSGKVYISGRTSHPEFSGFLRLDSVNLKMRDLNTSFFINDSIYIDRSSFVLKNMKIRDAGKGTSLCSGYYRFWEDRYNLTVTSDNFLLLNNGPNQNESFYGKVFISGITNLNNENGITQVTVNARTENDSHLYLPLTTAFAEEDGSFLHFVNAAQPLRKKGSWQTDKKGFVLNTNLELNDNLEVQIVLDPTIGDVLRARGNGDIKITLDQDGIINMFGEYKISKGDYLFTLSNLLNKKFILTPGGSIIWKGSPYDATMDIKAVYNLKTSLYELLSSANSAVDRSTKVPVECILNLSDNFTNPLVKFDINFPTLDVQTKSFIQSLFSSQDEINKQMFSLLILNKFYTPDYMNSTDIEERNAGYQAGVTTATELVSNQLSRWLSQISNNFDIGFSYRPGDNITTNEIEVALSTQLLNDRVTLSANGNVDVGGTKNVASNSAGGSNIAGDFDVEVKLNKQGTLKLKAYSHTDEKIIYSSKETVQGVGVSYQEAFDTFRELFQKYVNFFRKKKVEK